ncbi:MAG: hypothetical protein ABR964_05505 [Tepidisphaeraceae bacterium]|jgi:hypothetical protein
MSVPTRLNELCQLLIAGTKNDSIRWTPLKSGVHTAVVGEANFIVKGSGSGDEGLTGVELRVLNDAGDQIDLASVDRDNPDDYDMKPLDELYDVLTDQEDRMAQARLTPILESLRKQVMTRPPKR